jgi:hypothetical protein
MDFILIFVGLAIGNYLYQAFGDHLWMVALERSWYQLVALTVAFIVFSIKSNLGG